MKSVSIIIPVYNEEKVLKKLYKRLFKVIDNLKEYKFEVLFINDGSYDNTSQILGEIRNLDKRVSYINLSRNFGKEIAMIAGFDYIIGDCAIVMDADLQHPPEIIPEMLCYWEEGYDDVYAKRKDRKKESFIKRVLSECYYGILKKISEYPIQENVGDFRLLDRRCVEALKRFRESKRNTKGMYSWIGYNKKEILYEPEERVEGNSKWTYFKLLNLAIDGITSCTIAPLRISTILGTIISICAFIYMVLIIFKTIIFGEVVKGFPTIMVIVLFLGGVQLLSIGILGEYIGRMFSEIKNRPLYLIDTINGKKNNIGEFQINQDDKKGVNI